MSVCTYKYPYLQAVFNRQWKVGSLCRNLCCRNLFFLQERRVKIHSRNLADNFREFYGCFFYSGLVCEGFIRFVKSCRMVLCIVWRFSEFRLVQNGTEYFSFMMGCCLAGSTWVWFREWKTVLPFNENEVLGQTKVKLINVINISNMTWPKNACLVINNVTWKVWKSTLPPQNPKIKQAQG